jgi:hypothetical protein
MKARSVEAGGPAPVLLNDMWRLTIPLAGGG